MDQGAECWRRFRDGDDRGLTEIIDLYKESLALYLNTLTRDMGLAEELMEETFVKLAVRRPRYSGSSSFKTWLYAIGRNTAVDELRRRARRPQTSLEALPEMADEKAGLLEHVLKEERKIALHRAMEDLNPDYRQILYLSYFEEKDNRELARVLGLGRRQVENRLSRARAALKKLLEKEELFL